MTEAEEATSRQKTLRPLQDEISGGEWNMEAKEADLIKTPRNKDQAFKKPCVTQEPPEDEYCNQSRPNNDATINKTETNDPEEVVSI